MARLEVHARSRFFNRCDAETTVLEVMKETLGAGLGACPGFGRVLQSSDSRNNATNWRNETHAWLIYTSPAREGSSLRFAHGSFNVGSAVLIAPPWRGTASARCFTWLPNQIACVLMLSLFLRGREFPATGFD